MIIEIIFFSLFKDNLNTEMRLNDKQWNIPEGSTLGRVMEMVNISEKGRVFLINGRQAKKDAVLKEGDRLAVLLAAAGG